MKLSVWPLRIRFAGADDATHCVALNFGMTTLTPVVLLMAFMFPDQYADAAEVVRIVCGVASCTSETRAMSKNGVDAGKFTKTGDPLP